MKSNSKILAGAIGTIAALAIGNAAAAQFNGGGGNARRQEAAAQPAPTLANGEFRAGILRRHPNYNNFSEADIASLNEAELRGLLGFIGNKVNGYETLIPQSLVRQYGADAEAKFMQALAFDAARRGQPAMYALALLNSGLARDTRDPNGVVNSNVSVSLPLSNGANVQTTAPDAFNYKIASTAITALNVRFEAEATAKRTGTFSTYTPNLQAVVRVPPAAVIAIVAANPGLPRSLANENYSLNIRDEVAFLAGYATQAGASRNIGVVQIPLTRQDYCSAPNVRNAVYRANTPDVDIGTAFLAGAAMRQYDAMSDAEFERIRAGCA